MGTPKFEPPNPDDRERHANHFAIAIDERSADDPPEVVCAS